MKIGLLGLPLAGKTSVFNLLTGADAQTATYAGERSSHNGVAIVPDPRVDTLRDLFRPKKTTYAKIDIVDIPGLSQGGATEFAGPLQDADALVLIVRGFINNAIGIIDPPQPTTDLQDLLTELIICDLSIVERRLERLEKNDKGTKTLPQEKDALVKAKYALESEQLIGSCDFSSTEKVALKNFSLYTNKPMLVVLNASEEDLSSQDPIPYKDQLVAYTSDHHMPLLVVCAPLEEEISQLPENEQAAFLEDIGIKESGVARLARAAYAHLDLISYFTVGPDEVRAWTISRGTNARKAAGKIHSDIERGFIRAEVTSYEDMVCHQTMAKLREKGLLRLEGKEYPVADGDVISFRFNV